jgi:hypothetical protein
MGRVQMWRLHEFNFDSKLITSVLLHVLSKFLVMRGKVQAPQWFEYSCQDWTRSDLTPSRVHECFCKVSAIFGFFVKIQVPQVAERSCEGCTSSGFTGTWVRDCFSSCFLQDLLSLWIYRCHNVSRTVVRVLRIHLLTPKRITGLFLYVFHHVFFVHSEVTGVSCIKYIGDCFASTPSVLIGVRDFFCMFCVL